MRVDDAAENKDEILATTLNFWLPGDLRHQSWGRGRPLAVRSQLQHQPNPGAPSLFQGRAGKGARMRQVVRTLMHKILQVHQELPTVTGKLLRCLFQKQAPPEWSPNLPAVDYSQRWDTLLSRH